MMLKSGILMLLGTLSANAAFATIQMQAPDACPKISLIKSEGVSMAYQLPPKNYFFAFQESSYDTNHTWYFAIGFFETDSMDVALSKGNSALNKLSEPSKPYYDKEGYWVCSYNVVGTDLAAVAFYADQPISPLQTKHLLRKIR
ncbi:hypothetical protein BN59_00413 [Legionella massiliensis]|uniref:Hemin binding protein Hbp n=1 Tax=Legionella massiliensis TaxID=1034943 RepID=A0A078KT61_9GAMM|nr:DUF4949 domain-containing protein [Legionella massiliensis]CDZ76147.1 hypothetical protein BN59_00413 [Legionella massiliensis]CEE11885.1 hypothetical protein BN1094_00413 [Legionella massiliensis]